MALDFHIIANPAAGKGRARERLAPILRRLEGAGASITVEITTSPGHATELARAASKDGRPVVVALGGDGTVREVAEGLVATDTVMGILPQGSGNDFARSVGIPHTLSSAADVLVGGIVQAVDVGRDATGIFTGVCGIGFAAEVAYEANRTRFFRGSSAYFAGVFKALMHLKPVPVRLTLTDALVKHDAVFVMAQNTPFCGGGQLMAPDASLVDGQLDVVVVSDIGRFELVRTFPKVYSGRHVTHPAFHIYRSASVRVESDRPLLKILDGDVVGYEPMNATTLPGALRVLVPPTFASACGAQPVVSEANPREST